MKRAIIVHCWEGHPEYCWYPWAKQELESHGFMVEVPAFPDTDHPKMNSWVPKLREVVSVPSEDVYLIGHSIGCATIMRYLEGLDDGAVVGGVVLVAGFHTNVGYDEIQSFFESPIDLNSIKGKSKKGFVVIHSDNDPHVDLKYADAFREHLDAQVIIQHNKGHFSGSLESEDSCTKLPEVISSTLILSSRQNS